MNLSDEDLLILRSAFKKYDRENKGYLTQVQFALFLSRLSNHVEELKGLEYEEAVMVFKLLDKDSDDKLNFQEFCNWWSQEDKYQYFCGEKSKLLRKAYNLYIKYAESENGMSYNQFEKMMDELNITHSEFEFDELDSTGNGVLSFVEFVNWLHWF